MLTVRTFISKSEIEGNGLFADEDIAEGTVIWTFVPDFDIAYTLEQVEKFPQSAKDYIKRYAFKEDGKIIMTMDNDRFTNHSTNPNTKVLENGDVVASQKILAGTEITANYMDFDKSWADKL